MSLFLPFALLLQAPAPLPSPVPLDDTRDAVHGEAPVMPFEFADDSVPLPNPAVWKEGEQGDVLVEPRSGDPYFLGFIPGKHYPPASERIDPRLDFSDAIAGLDGRGHGEGYAFVMFGKRMTTERVEALRALGVRVLDFHPYYTLKVALAPELVERVASLDFVRWVGAVQPWQKVHPRLVQDFAGRAPGERVPVFINLFESDLCAASTSRPVGSVAHGDGDSYTTNEDESAQARSWMSNGWQQKRLQELGIEIRSYAESILAFRADMTAAQLEALVALDFVQFIELEAPMTLSHDQSMPLVNADRMRASYDGGTNSAAIVGVIDTGHDLGHTALDQFTVGWDFTPENLGAFQDLDGHGSHVSGTVLGNGDVDDSYQGAAPGLGWAASGRIFAAKLFNSNGSSLGVDFAALLGVMHSPYFDGVATTPRPMVVNNSYGSAAMGATGTEANARTIDAEVWDHDQMYVFAAGNEGPTASSCREQATAKNALTVGSVLDNGLLSGEMSNSSSRGPTGDGRWKPNVCAPGNSIYSIAAETVNGYTSKSGTSMAAPHVTGVAAQLCDRYSFLRYNPEALAAVLMATAITKNDQVLSTPASAASHLNNFGTGRVDAYKATGSNGQQSLYFWSTTLSFSGSTYVELPVAAGATRLSVVVHYLEQEASSGASQALRNDFDTWLDAEPYSAGNNSGEYSAQQSSVDNTEVRILNNPVQGGWRIKIAPVSTVLFDTVRVGICAVVTYGDTTPTPTLNVTANKTYVNVNELVTVTATYTNPSYVASAVYFDRSAPGASQLALYGNLADGSTANWTGTDVTMGNVAHASSRTANWDLRWSTEGIQTFSLDANSDNAVDVTDSVTVFVDSTPPPLPTGLQSTTHTPNVWTNDATITYTWSQAADNVSGVDGYGVFTSSGAAGSPSASKDIEQVLTYSETLIQGSWHFNLRPVDNSANWNASYASVGPFRIDLTAPAAVTGLASSTHQVNVQSCTTTAAVSWTAAVDTGGSGIAGYAGVWDSSPATVPAGALNIAAGATSFSQSIGSSTIGRYFHLRAKDRAGNWGATAHFGPVYANANSVLVYCTGKTNSLGCVPSIGTNGNQPSKSAGNFTVTCTNTLNQKFGLLFFGTQPQNVPFQGGTLCVASPTIRTTNTNSGGSASGNDCTGTYSFTFSTAVMSLYGMDPGESFYAQWWMRDPASPSTTGLSNAVKFTVCQ
jgi:subtilisin family serine protease